MNIFELIIRSINALRLMLNNPILGGGSNVRLSEASELFNILGSLILADGDEDAGENLEFFTETVEEMATTGRDPTPLEWVTLRGFNVDLLQTLKERLEDEYVDYSAEDRGSFDPESKDPESKEAHGHGRPTDVPPKPPVQPVG